MLCFSVCVCLCECLLCFVVAMAEEDLESAAVRALRAAVELVENKAEGEEKEEDGQEDDDEEEEHSQ